jgi:hypothetical protein
LRPRVPLDPRSCPWQSCWRHGDLRSNGTSHFEQFQLAARQGR